MEQTVGVISYARLAKHPYPGNKRTQSERKGLSALGFTITLQIVSYDTRTELDLVIDGQALKIKFDSVV